MTARQTNRKKSRRVRGRLLLGFFLLVVAIPGRACDIPVFRYALDNWPADSYQILVFHRGDLSSTPRTLLDSLRQTSAEGSANFTLTAVDLSTPIEPPLRRFWEAQMAPSLPWIVVAYPNAPLSAPPIWSGPFAPSTVSQLLDSPLRNECGKRILQGETAVWILLESGRSAIDDAAAKQLTTQLAAAAKDLSRDSLYVDPDDPQAPPRPALHPTFSLLRLSRADPAEQLLLAMLLNSEWDLQQIDAPIAFPIFGRGRSLYALIGDGISAANIRQACAFLVGDCSCQIKDQNPGTDLLMAVAWEREISPSSESPLPLVGMGSLAALADTSVSESEEVVLPAATDNPLPRNLLIILLIVGAIVATATLLLKKKHM